MSGYKKKTIEAIILGNANAWIKSITDSALAERVQDNYIVTGGAITSMLLGEQPNDFDVYFKDVDVAVDVANYYIKQYGDVKTDKVSTIQAINENGRVRIMIKSSGLLSEETDTSEYQYFEGSNLASLDSYFENKETTTDKAKYRPVMISGNAITLSNDIQIITRFTGDVTQIHHNFDFVHCTNYYSRSTGLVLNQNALESILAKELVYCGSLYPICSLFRIRKFIERGWTINAGQILKIAYDVSELDLTDKEVLQDQLVGVDAAYFYEVLSILNKNNDKPIDRTYLFEVITKVFE